VPLSDTVHYVLSREWWAKKPEPPWWEFHPKREPERPRWFFQRWR
jgi:hypothetical protein